MADADAWEEQLIAEMRAHGGRPTDGPLKGHPLMLLFSTGAKSGAKRRSILTYSRDGKDYVVAGTNGGNPDRHPAWLHNVQADPDVTLEIGDAKVEAAAAEVEGAERDRLWESHVAQLPWFGKYKEQISGRVIPVVRLTPRGTTA